MKNRRFLIRLLIACLLTGLLSGCRSAETKPAPTPGASALSERSVETGQFHPLRYLLYVPADTKDTMPLIVYLHGRSGKGADLSRLTEQDGFPRYLSDGRLSEVRAFVAIPQLPEDAQGWEQAADAVDSMIRAIAVEYPIDEGRISLTGHSMGGAGVWALALNDPTCFARIAPLSGGVRDTEENAQRLRNTPIRAFVGEMDTVVPPDSAMDFVARLQALGAPAEIIVLEDAGHRDVPAAAYLSEAHDLTGWLCFSEAS